MIPPEAIKKAIEGGWKMPSSPFRDHAERWENNHPLHPIQAARYWQIAALDPSFWQALGTALGWDRYQFTPVEFIRKHPSGAVTTEFKTPIDEWHQAALLFCSMILGEKNTDEFWEELLPAK